jgi:3-oxoadipate enol-lactonase
MLGIWLGAHAPERINRLVLCSTAAHIGTVESWNARIAAVRAGGIATIVPTLLERWFSAEFREREPGVVKGIRQMLLRNSVDGYIAGCAAVRDADLGEDVPKVRAPTQVITGLHDITTPAADGRLLVERISQATYAELDAAHVSNIEAAEPFTDVVLQFLLPEGR